MVAGGQGNHNYYCSKVEVIDLIDSSKENIVYQDNSMTRSNAIGGLLQNQPIVGGGFNLGLGGALQDYKILGQPDTSFQMLDTRGTSSSVVIDQTKLYVTTTSWSRK